MKLFISSCALVVLLGLSLTGCGPTKTEREVNAKMDSIAQADSIAKAEEARIEKERQDSIAKAEEEARAKKEARRKAGIMMSFTIPGKNTCTLYANGSIKAGKRKVGSWHKAYGVIQVEMDFGKYDSEIFEGFIIGDRLYYDFFGSEGACELSYNAAGKTITMGCDYITKSLSQCKSVKVTKEE
ncbi:MAG: cell envelope integrity protein TolA [Muribaculaceae bacterium]|nr:cell envelope integrity protein TolA [Muribaculaceae bacterium]